MQPNFPPDSIFFNYDDENNEVLNLTKKVQKSNEIIVPNWENPRNWEPGDGDEALRQAIVDRFGQFPCKFLTPQVVSPFVSPVWVEYGDENDNFPNYFEFSSQYLNEESPRLLTPNLLEKQRNRRRISRNAAYKRENLQNFRPRNANPRRRLRYRLPNKRRITIPRNRTKCDKKR